MSRKSVIYLCLTAVLAAYTVFAVVTARTTAAAAPYGNVAITVDDTAHTGFVTQTDIDLALGHITRTAKTTPRNRINTLALQNTLRALPKVEDATVLALNNGTLQIKVTPMVPVARVFDGHENYYINAAGKKLPADALHRCDVPVVSGHFDDPAAVTALLPMFAQIKTQPQYDALVTAVSIDRRGDIIITPAVHGHVINFGDTSLVADKMQRLRRFYHNVMPVRGWLYYDTVSVKWRGRVVATRRTKKTVADLDLTQLDGIVDEVPDDGTQAAGQGMADSLLNHRHKP